MRPLAVLLCAAALAWAGDVVHLENGRILEGTVVKEDAATIELRHGTGTVVIPRDRVRLIERGATRAAPRRVVTRRDEWFLVLHRNRVVGWRRLLHTEGPSRVTVEERTVFFRPGGGVDVDTRRVETADRDGRPLEFLLMETYGKQGEVISGQVEQGRVMVQVRRDGATRVRELKLPPGWVLPLPTWSRFLADAKPGETRSVTSLDVRRLKTGKLLLRRDGDAAGTSDARQWRELRLVGDFRNARALYRPGDGSLEVELNGPTLLARRSTRERVEMARRAHAGRQPIRIGEAFQFPFYRRPKDLNTYLPRAGIELKAPDAGWIGKRLEAGEGLVCTFEKLALFASLEVFVYPARDVPDPDACLSRALNRLRLTAERIGPAPEAERGEAGGCPSRTLALTVRHRGEDLRCLLTVVRAPDRAIVLVGAAPERWWRWAEKDFRAFVAALEVVP